ncbi:hypothetical protein [Arthrobacter psychrolactophilus]
MFHNRTSKIDRRRFTRRSVTLRHDFVVQRASHIGAEHVHNIVVETTNLQRHSSHGQLREHPGKTPVVLDTSTIDVYALERTYFREYVLIE